MHSENLRFAIGRSTLGPFALVASDKGIAAILLGADRQALLDDVARRFSAAVAEDPNGLKSLVAQAVLALENPLEARDLTLDPRGTAFQRRVWRALQEIPVGSTASYGEIARRIGAPRAVRAVAQACAANPIALAIPCHRVVRGNGATGGYRWGAERKAMLLQAEAAL